MKDDLMTIKETAEFLGMHEVTVRDKCRSGEIPAIKMGRFWRIKRSELNAWLEKQKN